MVDEDQLHTSTELQLEMPRFDEIAARDGDKDRDFGDTVGIRGSVNHARRQVPSTLISLARLRSHAARDQELTSVVTEENAICAERDMVHRPERYFQRRQHGREYSESHAGGKPGGLGRVQRRLLLLDFG